MTLTALLRPARAEPEALIAEGEAARATQAPQVLGSALADPDDATSIVAKYGKVHRGWVVVYGDGRVITSK